MTDSDSRLYPYTKDWPRPGLQDDGTYSCAIALLIFNLTTTNCKQHSRR